MKFSENEYVYLKQSLYYAMELTGFSPSKIGKDEIDFLLQKIIENDLNIKSHEIKQAFDLGFAGKLDIDLTHYQNRIFSPNNLV